MGRYQETYDGWRRNPGAFWAKAAEAVHWDQPFTAVLDDSNAPFCRWFPGAKCNTCFNALDRHVIGGRAKQAALIWDSAVTHDKLTLTYEELHDRVALAAGALRRLGVKKGDRVLIYMPMVPEAVVSMLACARLGAVHSVVFGGFSAEELRKRIDDAQPGVILSASCGVEVKRVIPYKTMIDTAIDLADHEPKHVVVLQREQCQAELHGPRDMDWQAFLKGAEPAECVSVASTDPLYILYTSGTTGVPKGVVRDNGGHMVALLWSMKNIYGVEPGEVYWAASDIGWVVGHSYIVYGPLLHGCTTVMFEGKPVGTPDAGAFWRMISEHKVQTLFTAPTAFRAIKQQDPEGKLIADYDLSHFRTLFLAGERADPATLEWAEAKLGVPVIDHWWQTESGWPMVSNCMGLEALPVKHGSPTCAVPGYELAVLDLDGRKLPPHQNGVIAVKLPLPPGCLPTLWQNDEGFVSTYLRDLPGYYSTGDAGFIDEDGYVYIMSRIDDLINVAGHRLSTGGIEEILAAHPDVAECAVVGIADSLKGQVPIGLVVLNAGVDRKEEDVTKELVALVREKLGAVASFKTAAVVDRLPKTRSGKVLRGTMRRIADGETYRVPATIDDPAILTEIEKALKRLGYPR